MASRKGSRFMKAVWERQKQLMVTHCPLSEKELEKVCCFDSLKVECHIPWAGAPQVTCFLYYLYIFFYILYLFNLYIIRKISIYISV